MGCPSGVCNASVRVEDLGQVWLLILDQLLELCDLAHLLEGEHFVFLVSIYGQTSRIVATVFESGESIDKSIKNELPILLHQIVCFCELVLFDGRAGRGVRCGVLMAGENDADACLFANFASNWGKDRGLRTDVSEDSTAKC